jgi:predicted enzyme related to lactoylglutathione lyase
MAHKLAHFAIHANDVERAKQFYGKVFDWDFRAYGPADFCQIEARGAGPVPIGAIESRRYNVLDRDVFGFECSISVEDVDAIAKAVEAAGGVILMKKTAIPHVGWIVKFRDTEGNVVCAVHYTSEAR